MKAMILSDFMTARKYLWQQLALCVVLGAFIDFMSQSIYATPLFTTFMVTLSLAFSVVALDEANDWQAYRLALPLSRRTVVMGRYGSIGLVLLVSMALGVLTSLLVLGFANLFPAMENCAVILGTVDWGIYGVMVALSLLLCGGVIAMVLPACFRFGMTKAIRWFPLVAVLVMLLGFLVLGDNTSALAFAESLFDSLSDPGKACAAAAIVAAAAAVLYAASCALSVKLYRTRQF